MKDTNLKFIITLTIATVASYARPAPIKHWQLQAVHPDGSSSFDDNGAREVVLEGIILNSPEHLHDPAPDPTIGPWQMGGQWEVYVQGEADDHAGTALWMGQNYGNGPGYENYTNTQWTAEICRLNRDPNTGYVFSPGDRVRVRGRYLFYKGKLNINENHEISPDFDFSISLLEPAVGLPQPEVVPLSELKDPNDNEIFDSTRLRGCEYYQSRLIRINDVSIIDAENWGIGQTVTIQDANGLTFPVKLGRGAGIGCNIAPKGQIDVIGILDQEASGRPPIIDNTKGYQLLVLNYDGNGLVLTDRGRKRGNLSGDLNADFKVDFRDFVEISRTWLECQDGLCHCRD